MLSTDQIKANHLSFDPPSIDGHLYLLVFGSGIAHSTPERFAGMTASTFHGSALFLVCCVKKGGSMVTCTAAVLMDVSLRYLATEPEHF